MADMASSTEILRAMAAPYGTHKTRAADLPSHLKTPVCPGCGGKKYRYAYLCIVCSGGSRLDQLNPALDATKIPDEIEIAWAAGFWEGEGSVNAIASKSKYTVSVGQNYIEPLERLRDHFGGSIYVSATEPRTFYTWNVNGRRARDFMVLIKKQLSPRRLEQLARADQAWENRHGE